MRSHTYILIPIGDRLPTAVGKSMRFGAKATAIVRFLFLAVAERKTQRECIDVSLFAFPKTIATESATMSTSVRIVENDTHPPSVPGISRPILLIPLFCVLAAVTERVILLVLDVPLDRSVILLPVAAVVVVWFVYYTFRVRRMRRQIQRWHFLKACDQLAVQDAQGDRFRELAQTHATRLRLERLNVELLAIANGGDLTLAWIETTHETDTGEGSYASVESTLVGSINRNPVDDDPPTEDEDILAYLQPIPKFMQMEDGCIFRVDSFRKSRHRGLPLMQRWHRQAVETLDWNVDEIVASVRAAQAQLVRSNGGDLNVSCRNRISEKRVGRERRRIERVAAKFSGVYHHRRLALDSIR